MVSTWLRRLWYGQTGPNYDNINGLDGNEDDETTPLITETTNPRLVFESGRPQNRVIVRNVTVHSPPRWQWRWCRCICQLLLVLFLIIAVLVHLLLDFLKDIRVGPISPTPAPCYHCITPRPQPECNPIPPPMPRGVNTSESHFEMDFMNSKNITIVENITRADFPGGITGSIIFHEGRFCQQFDMEIYVQASSVDMTTPARINAGVVWSRETAGNLLLINSTAASTTTASQVSKQPLDVKVYIYLRPPRDLYGSFSATAENLNITLQKASDFQIYNTAELVTNHGDIISNVYEESLESSFRCWDMNVTSKLGGIYGNWLLSGQTKFSASKDVDVNVLMSHAYSGRWAHSNLTVTAGGNVDVRMPFDPERIFIRNGVVDITSHKGNINATIIHSVLTKLHAESGGISADLLPFWAGPRAPGWQRLGPDEDDEIPGKPRLPHLLTSSLNSTNIRVRKPIICERYDYINPMNKTTSRHLATDVIDLIYPNAWGGLARVKSDNGFADIAGPGLNITRTNDHSIAGEKEGDSDMKIHSTEGSASLSLEDDEEDFQSACLHY